MNILIFNPQLVINSKDKFTTGIIYLPILLASISSNLKKNNIDHKIIDLFGNNTYKIKKKDNFLIAGEETTKYEDEINKSDIIFIYASQVINHLSVIDLLKTIRSINEEVKIFILENTQAVTAYSLKNIANEFLLSDNDHVLLGESEKKVVEICKNISTGKSLENLKGIITSKFSNLEREIIDNLDDLPFPDWSEIPLKNYWHLKYAHGPFSSKKYISILTSRGCPYPCEFCVVPETNNRKWRFKSPNKVVDEIEYLLKKYSVNEFHLEDLNPTVNDKRTKEICREIIRRNININWKIVAGTKVESIKDYETVKLMADSGCKYVSISPESGSENLMKKINKPFNKEHAYKIVKYMNENKIFTQACFVLGFPGESKEDLKMTKEMIIKLTKKGIDEIALFIISPIPGSNIYKKLKGFKSLSDLNFSPIWRDDYNKLFLYRIYFYFIFVLLKFIYHPIKFFNQILNFFTKNFQTKMEMVPYKYLKLSFNNMFNNEKN